MNSVKVLVAMSGGVDSSVAAYLLKKQGYQVHGVTLTFKIPSNTSASSWTYFHPNDAKKICEILQIPHQSLDITTVFERDVIHPFIGEYLVGRTPNPCIICNRHIKFGFLYHHALKNGYDFLATGHYAFIEKVNGRLVLKKPVDRSKDQTYFLYNIRQETLQRILFPLACLTKKEVIALSQELGFPAGKKPESQDICFLPKGRYRDFIQHRTQLQRPGPIIDLQGRIIGQHQGVFLYTVGQRKGLGISASHPLYVVDIDPIQNTITVGEKKDVLARVLIADQINLFLDIDPNQELYAKTRYSQQERPCTIDQLNDTIKVVFKLEQENITPGQSVVFYTSEGIVVGGGIIKEVIR